jgi:hypothetical protein
MVRDDSDICTALEMLYDFNSAEFFLASKSPLLSVWSSSLVARAEGIHRR